MCFLALVSLRQSEAAPLDALRTIWVMEDSAWTANPTHLARSGRTSTEIEFRRHRMSHSLVGESATQTVAGSQTIQMAHGSLRIDGRDLESDLRLETGSYLLSSRQQDAEQVCLSYGLAFGRHLDLGAMARVALSAGLHGGAVGMRLNVAGWIADAHVHGSSVRHSAFLNLRDQTLEVGSAGLFWEEGLTLHGPVSRWSTIAVRGIRGTARVGDQRGGYRLDPEWRRHSIQGSWQATIRRGYAVMADVRYRTLKADLDGHLDDRQFLRSQIDYGELGGALWLRRNGAGRDYLDVGLFASRGEASVRRGRLEIWPFFNSVASLLGGKDWTGSGQTDFVLVGAGVRLQQRLRAWMLGTDTRVLHASSEVRGFLRERRKLDLSSLLFPTTHRESGEIQIDAIDFKLSIGYEPSSWNVHYQLSQIIPVRVQTFFEIDSIGGEGMSGFHHRLVISFVPEAVPHLFAEL